MQNAAALRIAVFFERLREWNRYSHVWEFTFMLDASGEHEASTASLLFHSRSTSGGSVVDFCSRSSR
jgi:hypothetical protein